ncbi:MAG TPA: COX15/CtaA family protein [Thermoplasmata archaeon]|nr:COX15/CtaA family protein [Thermoplasmata archaeon]
MRGHDLFRFATLFAVVLCYATILLGGNVMASDSGLACPSWPSCYGNGNFLPAFQGGAAIEWSHRVMAFFLSSSVLVLAVLAVAFERGRPALLRMSVVALGLVVTEALLGGLVVENSLAVTLVLVHLAIATALFGLLLVLSLLANFRELPTRWVAWARRALDETPPSESDPTATPAPFPAEPGRASAHPREG